VEIMSDQDRSRERGHWQAIAEQLGLGPEPESTAAEPAAKRAAAQDPVASRVEPVAKGAFKADLVAEESIRTPAEPERLTPDEAAAAPVLDDENQAATAQESSEVEPEPRSRRRGRPRRKERPQEAPADEGRTATAAVDSREEAAEGSEQQTNRRSRGRKVKAAVRSSEAAQESVADQPDKDDDLDDLDDFSEWNVPSWNELIASLYRPGR
jgi:hypothetical protein